MCYWFAGSTYEVHEDLYSGKSEDLLHAKKAGKLGPITGYRQIRDKLKDGDMSGLVKLVRSFEENGGDKKIREVSDAELREVVEKELQEIPSFKDLCQRSRERRDQVMAAIEQREREERERQEAVAREQEKRLAAEAKLAAVERQLAEKEPEAERAGERLAAAEQQLAEERAELLDLQRRLKTLEAQVGRA